jgi:hypothetical protein
LILQKVRIPIRITSNSGVSDGSSWNADDSDTYGLQLTPSAKVRIFCHKAQDPGALLVQQVTIEFLPEFIVFSNNTATYIDMAKA